MKRLAAALGLGLCWLGSGCDERYAQTAELSNTGGATSTPGYGGAPACAGTLQLSQVRITLPEDIRYKAAAYDTLMRDERVALAIGPDQKPNVAWLNNSGNTVHITALNNDGTLRGPDAVLPSSEVGGLVALADGFMVLTSGPDPGDEQLDPNDGNVALDRAALLTRFEGTTLSFTRALTGSQQLGSATSAWRHDCTPTTLRGRLAFNGVRYGAYFDDHGCVGHPRASQYGDKLVYMDPQGNVSAGGFTWFCSINMGTQLLAEATGPFSTFGMCDGSPGQGLNQLFEGRSSLLSPEYATQGYVGAQFGGAVKMADGSYVLAWSSRGPAEPSPQDAPDIAFMRLKRDFSVATPRLWLTQTPAIAENNVHVAPWGPDKVVVIWDSVEITMPLRRMGETFLGTYVGTRARLFDLNGVPLGDEQPLDVPPNSEDDIAVYANRDLGWAIVPDAQRSYSAQWAADGRGVPLIDNLNKLSIARLVYCQ
ncbi:MAG: hypothetical protein QM756_03840 [Polyangiaceae bacterium]